MSHLFKSKQNLKASGWHAIYLLLIIMLLIQNPDANAQAPYQTIFTDSLYYYAGNEWLPVFFDSSVVSGSDTVYYPYRENRKANGLPGTCRVDNRSVSWLGDSVRIRQDGENIFYNQSGEPISLQTTVGFGYKYHLFNFPNGDYIEATHTGGKLEPVFDVVDYTKIFTLQAKNSAGVKIAHPMNGKTFKLSLNYGLIQAYNFNLFPNDTTMIKPGGMPFRNKGNGILNSKMIFNIKNGYELHFIGRKEYCGFSGCRKDSILESRFLIMRDSLSPDTLLMYWKRAVIDFYDDPVTGIGTDAYQDTITDTIIFSRLAFLDTMSRQLFQNDEGWGYSVTYRSDSTGLGFVKRPFNGFDFDSIGHCLSPGPAQSILPLNVYGDGLGNIYYKKMMTGIGFEERKMLYYQKGLQTWGTPLDFSVLGTIALRKNDVIKVFPNPARGNIRVELPKNAERLRLIDLYGNIVEDIDLQGYSKDIDLDLTGKPAGLYMLEIRGKKAYGVKRLILQ